MYVCMHTTPLTVLFVCMHIQLTVCMNVHTTRSAGFDAAAGDPLGEMQVSFMQCVAVCCLVLQWDVIGVLVVRNAGVIDAVCCSVL